MDRRPGPPLNVNECMSQYFGHIGSPVETCKPIVTWMRLRIAKIRSPIIFKNYLDPRDLVSLNGIEQFYSEKNLGTRANKSQKKLPVSTYVQVQTTEAISGDL